jgi:peptide/nickel transport system permease protein
LEVIFNWPGLGQVTLNGLLHWDTPLVAGCVILSTLLLVTGNLAADLLLMVLDPRTRIQDKAL